MKIIAKINFVFNGKEYLKDEEVEVDNIEQVYKLNEFGYIKPLKYEELIKIKRELKSKEEKQWT